MSAYRSAPQTDTRRRNLLCESCGAFVGFSAAEVECVCRLCQTRQPTSRADTNFRVGRLKYVADDGRPYDELKDFCAGLGVRHRAMSVTVDVDGVELVVSLAINSGTANGLELQARTRGLPPMSLSREGAGEREAKARGISREVQTGDEAFDHEVYIDTEVVDADVLAVFEPPAVRAAVRALLAAFPRLKIDGAAVSLSGNHDEPTCYHPSNIRAWLAALRVLAGAPRPSEVRIAERSTAVRLVYAGALVVMPASLAALIAACRAYEPLHCASLVFVGIPLGLVLWRLWLSLLRPVLSGHSSSHEQMMLASAGAFFGLPMACIAALFALNGALDRSPERGLTGKVTSVKFDSEDDTTSLSARGDELDVGFVVHDPRQAVKVGDAVTVWTRAGALGVPWSTRAAKVVSSGATFLEK